MIYFTYHDWKSKTDQIAYILFEQRRRGLIYNVEIWPHIYWFILRISIKQLRWAQWLNFYFNRVVKVV